MKKYLVIALAAVALTACKNKVTPDAPQPEEGDLMITTKASDTKALLPDYQGNTNNFFAQDELGFFMAATTTTDPTTTVIPDTYKFWDATATPTKNAANFGYVFGTPYWTPLVPETAKLKYQKEGGVQLFAYFPRQASDNSVATSPVKFPTTLDETTNPVLEYQIPENQTSAAVLRTADLMWAKNTNSDMGFMLSSKPVTMTFNHLMARANVGVKLFSTQPQTKTYTLRAVIVNGNQINVDKATFNVVSGKLTTAGKDASYNGQVYYFDNADNAGAFTSAVVPAAINAATAIDFATADATPVKRLDLLVYPFEQELTKNNLIFIVSDNDIADFSTKYPNVQALQAGVTAGNNGLYSYSYGLKARVPNTASAPDPNNGAWLFDAGTNNILNVNIDISSKAIDIITTINPWTNLPGIDVPAE